MGELVHRRKKRCTRSRRERGKGRQWERKDWPKNWNRDGEGLKGRGGAVLVTAHNKVCAVRLPCLSPALHSGDFTDFGSRGKSEVEETNMG